jgi:hypothetical protein
MQQNEGNDTAAKASTDFCDLDMICESAARIGFELAELPCDEQSPVVSEGIVVRLPAAADGKCSSCAMKLRRAKNLKDIAFCPKCWKFYSTAAGDAVRWLLSERGMANFVGRKIALGWAQPAGAVFHLGEVNQRDLYFSIRPPSQFFSAHNNKNVSLVVGNSAAEIPNGWNGQLAFFNELFYYHKNELRVAPNICDRILPKARTGLRRGKNRVIHERRDFWLRFLVSLFAKDYNPKDFFKGAIRRTVVRNWFVKTIPGAPSSSKTYKRDYDQFRTYHGKDGECDFREPAIIMLLKKAADPKFTRRKEMAQTITDILLQLKEDEQKFGHAVEIPKCAWQYTGDKSGTRTLVSVAPEDNSIDDLEF